MRVILSTAMVVAFLVVAQLLFPLSAGAKADDDAQRKRLENSVACLYCHRQSGFEAKGLARFDFARYDAGAHAEIACVDCHLEFSDSPHRAAGESVENMALRCETCHEAQTTKYESGVHLQAGVECVECHSSHYPPRFSRMDEGQLAGFVVGVCLRCHSTAQEDAASVVFNDIHAQRVGAGDVRVPVCNTCHGSHDTKSFTSQLYGTQLARMAVCIPCHPDIDSQLVANYSHEPMHRSFPVVHVIIVLMIGLLVLEGGQMGAFLVLDLRRHAINMRTDEGKDVLEPERTPVATPGQRIAVLAATPDAIKKQMGEESGLQDLTEEEEDLDET